MDGMGHIRGAILAALACLTLSGCQGQLYGSLSEAEANSILAALLEAAIPAEKRPGAEGTYAVFVEEAEFARAVRILEERALPGKRFDDLGTVFGRNAMFSTPVEENARYLYALQEELSRTVSEIDGVLVARVHLVLPETDQLGRELRRPSAAVFVKHVDDERHDPEMHPRQIRDMVSASVPNLEKSAIVVSFFPVAARNGTTLSAVWTDVFGLRVAEGSAGRARLILYVAAGACLLLAAVACFAFFRKAGR